MNNLIPSFMRRTSFLIATCLCLLFYGKSIGATVLYSEKFNNSTGANLAANAISWNSYLGATANNISTQNTCMLISTGTSNPSTDGAGYLAFSGTATFPAHTGTAAFTTTFTGIDATGSTITWNMGNSAPAATVQLLVQVGGSWYVSNQTFQNTGSYTTFSTVPAVDAGQTFNFAASGSTWSSFTLIPYSSLTVGSTVSNLGSSTITGIGFYISNATDLVVRLDTLAVTVPEPSIAALFMASAMLLVWRIRNGARGLRRSRA